MNMDSRQIDPKKVIELVEEKINTKYFICSLYACNVDELIYDFVISAKSFDYKFIYLYRPKAMYIRDMNKILKRKDNGDGVTTEQLVADEIYTKFMAEWISMAKPNKNKKEED